MKNLFSTLFLALGLMSCDFGIDLDDDGILSPPGELSGTPATFTIHYLGSTYEIDGDAYKPNWQAFEGPGSSVSHMVVNYSNIYELFCTDAPEASDLYLHFTITTDSLGKPIGNLNTGPHPANDGFFQFGEKVYRTHHNDPAIDAQLCATVLIEKITEGRIDGTFTGKFYQTEPVAGTIIDITGEFKNVYVVK